MSDGVVSDSGSFPVTPRNRVKRVHERGRYDRDSVFAVLDAGLMCHVAYAIEGQPYCTPTIHWRDGDMLYWHGSSASRMLRHLKVGTPACLTVSHLDGLVLARSGFNHSVNYRAAMCFGTARLVEDPQEKVASLDAMIERFYPGRSGALRTITTQELKATTVVGMLIEDASAKVRAKGVGDNEDDYDHPVWAGIIPVRTVIGEDEPCPRLLAGMGRPEGLTPYTAGRRLDEALLETQDIYEGAAS